MPLKKPLRPSTRYVCLKTLARVDEEPSEAALLQLPLLICIRTYTLKARHRLDQSSRSTGKAGGAATNSKLHGEKIDQKLTLIVSSGWDKQRVTALSWQEIVIYYLKKSRFMWLWAPLALEVDFYDVTCIWLLF